MRFVRIAPIYLTRFPGGDLSLGLHWCWQGRLDLHIALWMISIGNVPIYKDRDNRMVAVSNSFHKWSTDIQARRGKPMPPLRAGVPT